MAAERARCNAAELPFCPQHAERHLRVRGAGWFEAGDAVHLVDAPIELNRPRFDAASFLVEDASHVEEVSE